MNKLRVLTARDLIVCYCPKHLEQEKFFSEETIKSVLHSLINDMVEDRASMKSNEMRLMMIGKVRKHFVPLI